MAKHVLIVTALAVVLTGIPGVLNSYEPLLQMAAIYTTIFVVTAGRAAFAHINDDHTAH